MRRRFAYAVLSFLTFGCGDDDSRGDAPPLPPVTDPAAAEGLGPRQLRLLTRREYNATVADLFAGAPAPATPTCTADAACDIHEESCVGGACQKDGCELVTFVLEGYPSSATVLVAGSFNGWGATEQAGGYGMTFEPSLGAWVTKRAIADGSYAYKFVIDGVTWLADPSNPSSEPDGFGGVNSLLAQACAGEPDPADAPDPQPKSADYAKDFPVESRPEGYPFDNASSALVTSTHVEQYLRAGERIAEERAADLLPRYGCAAQTAADPCVRDAVEAFGRRAFRRPLSKDEGDRLHALVAAQPELATGVRVFLQVALSSPAFLYRSEIGEDAGDGTVRLTPYETATALSYTLIGSTPSDALLDAAEAGALDTPEGIEAEARGLLEDPRAAEMMGLFAEQWLAIETIEQAAKKPELYPEFDAALAADMKSETRSLFVDVALGAAPFQDLFLAERTGASGRLAQLYGAGADGALPPARRAGLLAQASVLAAQSHSDQTSPVRRGVFVRTRLLCQELAPPPPNAGGVPEVDPNASTRERFSQHSSDPTCNGCHKNIDPIGFGFEGFDAIGRARETDAGKPVDVSGAVTSVEGFGTDTDRAFVGLPELGRILAESQSAKTCLVKQLYRRASGGLETPDDEGTVGSLAARFADSGHDVGELVVALTQVKAFSYRRAQ
ncbi:MAG: DUF1592 domain-containing protein [Myxococcales bacterium]|nr:DUF1592 domain-containing protein [Myxococcales bacterium]